MSTTKVLPKSSSPKPKKCCSSKRCPVDDTGRNSVKPSTTPSTMALIRSNSMCAPRKTRPDSPQGLFAQARSRGNRKGRSVPLVCYLATKSEDRISAMITLFHHPFCPHSRFVRLVLGEYGLDSKLVEERVWERREDFLKINPDARTPVLIEEGRPAVPGAMIIAEYLDETRGADTGDRRLLPADAESRVEA